MAKTKKKIEKKVIKYSAGETVRVKSYTEIIEYLEKNGFDECSNGNWRKWGYPTFYAMMFSECGNERPIESVSEAGVIWISGYGFHSDWVEHV